MLALLNPLTAIKGGCAGVVPLTTAARTRITGAIQLAGSVIFSFDVRISRRTQRHGSCGRYHGAATASTNQAGADLTHGSGVAS